MTVLVILIVLACYPICLAITASGKAGFRGCIGFARWVLISISREAWVLEGALGKFERECKSLRAAWKSQEAR